MGDFFKKSEKSTPSSQSSSSSSSGAVEKNSLPKKTVIRGQPQSVPANPAPNEKPAQKPSKKRPSSVDHEPENHFKKSKSEISESAQVELEEAKQTHSNHPPAAPEVQPPTKSATSNSKSSKSKRKSKPEKEREQKVSQWAGSCSFST